MVSSAAKIVSNFPSWIQSSNYFFIFLKYFWTKNWFYSNVTQLTVESFHWNVPYIYAITLRFPFYVYNFVHTVWLYGVVLYLYINKFVNIFFFSFALFTTNDVSNPPNEGVSLFLRMRQFFFMTVN